MTKQGVAWVFFAALLGIAYGHYLGKREGYTKGWNNAIEALYKLDEDWVDRALKLEEPS